MDSSDVESTPISFDSYRVHHATAPGPGSLAGERVCRSQYCAASAEDMAHKAIRLNPKEFLKRFFPLSPSSSPSADLEARVEDRPRCDHNVFRELEDAENMLEAEVAALFVRLLLRVAYNPANGYALDRCGQSA